VTVTNVTFVTSGWNDWYKSRFCLRLESGLDWLLIVSKIKLNAVLRNKKGYFCHIVGTITNANTHPKEFRILHSFCGRVRNRDSNSCLDDLCCSRCAMVRPVASDENKQIGLLFAVAVTSPAVRKKGSSSDKPVLLLTTLRTKELGC